MNNIKNKDKHELIGIAGSRIYTLIEEKDGFIFRRVDDNAFGACGFRPTKLVAVKEFLSLSLRESPTFVINVATGKKIKVEKKLIPATFEETLVDIED